MRMRKITMRTFSGCFVSLAREFSICRLLLRYLSARRTLLFVKYLHARLRYVIAPSVDAIKTPGKIRAALSPEWLCGPKKTALKEADSLRYGLFS